MPPRRRAPAKPRATKKDNNDAENDAPQQQQPRNSQVANLFNQAQNAGTAAAARKLADLLWSAFVREQRSSEQEETDCAFWLELERCVSHLLVVPQGPNPHADRALRFVAAFAGSRPRLGGGATEEEHEAVSSTADALVERLLSLLASATAAADRGVRARSAGLLASCLNAQGEEAELSERLAVSLAEAAAARLADRAPPVRAAAVRVLGRLADPGPTGDFEGDPVTSAYLRLLRTERHRDVRRAVVACAPLCSRTLPSLVERSRDSDDGVRRAVFVVLAEKVPMAALTIGARCALLDRGLGDRVPSVAQAARAMLVRWLDAPAEAGGCDGDVGALLCALDVDGGSGGSENIFESATTTTQKKTKKKKTDLDDSSSLLSASPSSSLPSREAVAEAALRALDAQGRLHPAPLARAAAETSSGLRRKQQKRQGSNAEGEGEEQREGGAPPMSPEEALLWRVVASILSDRACSRGRSAANATGAVAAAHAAAASEALSALECALPETVEALCDLVRDAVAAANGSADRFSVERREDVFSERDAAEAARRHRFVARQLVRVVASVGDLADEAGRSAAASLLGFLLADAPAAAAQLSDEVADDDDGEEEQNSSCCPSAAREWTDSLAALARACRATPSEACPHALSSIALRLPGQFGGYYGSNGMENGDDDDELPPPPTGDVASWRGCLLAASALLRCLLPNSRVNSRETHGPLGSALETLADLRPALVAPALCHSSPSVRAAAVEAAGLLTLASDDGGEVAALVAALRAAAVADVPSVAARALRALSDATLVRGPRALDALVAEVDEEENEEEEEEEENDDQVPPTSSDANAAAGSEASPAKEAAAKREQNQRRKEQPQPILALLADAVSTLESDVAADVAGAEAAAEGLAKILLHRGADDAGREVSDGAAVASLSKLLAVVGEGDALAAPRARQALAVFFPLYAARGARASARLGAAALPAARAAISAEGGKASSGADVLRYVAGVLGSVSASQAAQRQKLLLQQQQQGRRFGGHDVDLSLLFPPHCPAAALLTSRAAVALFREAARVSSVAVAKPYAAAAVTLACAMPLLLPQPATATTPVIPDAERVKAAADAAARALPQQSGAVKAAEALSRRLAAAVASAANAAATTAAAAGSVATASVAAGAEDDVAARLAATALGSQQGGATAAAPAATEGAGEVAGGTDTSMVSGSVGVGRSTRAATATTTSNDDDDDDSAAPSSAAAPNDDDGLYDEEEENAFWSSLFEEAGATSLLAPRCLPFQQELETLSFAGGVGGGRSSAAAAAAAAADDDGVAAAATAGGGATPLRRTRRAAAAAATGRLRKVVADDVTSGSSSESSDDDEESENSDGNESDVGRRSSRARSASPSKIEEASDDVEEDADEEEEEGNDENAGAQHEQQQQARSPSFAAAASPALSLSEQQQLNNRQETPAAAARSPSVSKMLLETPNAGAQADVDLEEALGRLSGSIARLSPAI